MIVSQRNCKFISFTNMHVLNSNRLSLTPLRLSHLNELHELFIRPEVRAYLWDNEIIDIATTRSVIETSIQLMETGTGGLWLIRPDEYTLAGFAGLYFFFDEPQAQLLYGLHGDYWGKGYATEAAKAVIQHAFEDLGFSYLLAAMDGPHAASRKVCERLGMTFYKSALENGKETVWYKIEKT